ncbi:MAG: HK97 gp10 family phage protein [Nitrososphaerota archaeon]|nr:HK97 gp10 family phage protein [Candidatus Calditenuaceae archaeon]MDW8073960.1 HK97 gp10 family phage protein [Nitrososphaerota archaeon]
MEFKGLEELEAALRKLAAELDSRADEELGELARLFLEEARARTPVKTGRLRDSIVIRREAHAKYSVEATAPYAGYVEYGSGPHIIEPTKASALKFSISGKTVYTRRVRHPGSSPRPYWRPAFSEAAKAASRLLARVVRPG